MHTSRRALSTLGTFRASYNTPGAEWASSTRCQTRGLGCDTLDMVPRATYGTLRASTSFAIFPLHLSQFSFLLLCLLSLPLPIPSLSHLIPSSSYNDHAFFVPTSRSQNLLPNFAAPCSFSSLLFSYSIRFLISFALSLISHTPLFLSLFVLRPTFSPKHPSPLFHFSPFYRHTSFTLPS